MSEVGEVEAEMIVLAKEMWKTMPACCFICLCVCILYLHSTITVILIMAEPWELIASHV